MGPDEPVRYRRVALRCGSAVLSHAGNWYVPARLTPAMNAALDGSDIAFDRAVQALGFTRHTLDATVLPWPQATAGAEAGTADAAPDPPADVIAHRAVLTLSGGTPFSLVAETYTRAVLGFAVPHYLDSLWVAASGDTGRRLEAVVTLCPAIASPGLLANIKSLRRYFSS